MSRVRSAEHQGVASRVLIVDDDRDERTLVATALELAGLSSIQAESADEALRTLATEQVDAVILDRSMPGTDGIECLRLIRRSTDTARIPVIMVTSASGKEEIVTALDLGADDYVVKPFAPDELVARVMRLIRGQAEWVSLLRDEVHRRTSLLSAAASSSTTTTVGQGAMDLTEELYALDNARGAAMVELIGDDVVVLSSKGDDPMEHVSNALRGKDLGAYLSARATLGPWLEPITDPTSSSVVSLVPIRVDDVVVGLVATMPGSGATRSDIDRVHATAMDFALLATAVFGSALLASAKREEERRSLIAPIEAGEFTIVFQPVLCLESGNVVGHEALTRFGDGADTARTFARAAHLGVTPLLEIKTLEAAISQAADLRGDGWIAVNVSPSVLLREDLSERLRHAGDRDVLLELSEVEPVVDYDAVRAAVQALGPGVSLSVDDACAGFASLAHVLALRATYVKIDRSWITGIEHDPAKRALVSGIGNFAAESSALVIAEGIETEEELDTVRDLGIHLGQGYLLGRPLPL